MTEIIEALSSTYFGECVLTFFMSMIPVVELRGAIPVGVSLGLPVPTSAIVSMIGNFVPVPFIILFIRRIFGMMRRWSKRLGRIADKLERKAVQKGSGMYRGQLIGLLLFVAVPLPGTGAWTGALIAAILNIRLRNALPVIAAGIIIAGILVSIITFGFKSLI